MCLNGISYLCFLNQIKLFGDKKHLHFVSMPCFSGKSVSDLESLADTSIG